MSSSPHGTQNKSLTLEFEMGFTEILTIAFIILKLTGHIAWPWLLVVSPSLIGLAIALAMIVIGAVLASR